MELKYPDDEEKKNSVCLPMIIPETSEEYFLAARTDTKVQDLLKSELGFLWMRSRRCYDVYHFTLSQTVSFLWMAFSKVGAFKRKIDLCCDKIREKKQ